MGEPDQPTQNFALYPSVANWVHSTSLAQLDHSSADVQDQSPDDFYKSSYHGANNFDSGLHASDMTSTRQRQPTSNGAVRSTAKPSVRSVSGPAPSSVAAARAAQLPVNRPTVKSLAQRFNLPSSAESSPPSTRVRPVRPASSTKSITDTQAPAHSASSSPAPTTREAAYGSFKFNNLRQRERPQPAPASPASVRRSTRDEQTTPSRRKLSSPTRGQAAQQTSNGRMPFFGEVVGEHDELTPGFGIPTAEAVANDTDPIKLQAPEKSTIKLVNDDSHHSTQAPSFGYSPAQHRRNQSEMTSTSVGDGQAVQQSESLRDPDPRRRSPPSRIPVATRRMSAASDSSSSTRSLKFGSAGASYRRTSPIRSNNTSFGNGNGTARRPKPATQQMLPTTTYHRYHERAKSPQAGGLSSSLAAVITSPPAPTSPRLRNSRERQLLQQDSPTTTEKVEDPNNRLDYFEDRAGMKEQGEAHLMSLEQSHHFEDASGEQSRDVPPTAHDQPLTVHTSALNVPRLPAPLSATTDFEQDESPVLGMPGSFMMTPPIAQYTPPVGSGYVRQHEAPSQPTTAPLGELLQAHTFQFPTRSYSAETPSSDNLHTASSDFAVRESTQSIPIMLGADEQQWNAPSKTFGHSPRLSIGAHRWRAEPLDSSGTISYLDEDDSPIDPFRNRDSLRPDDSASIAFYRQAERQPERQADRQAPEWTPKPPAKYDSRRLTMDSEAYSVINKVLNLYHQSSVISPEVAWDSQQQVRGVSPVIAQHEDWGSKEATETYLARLLSDATITNNSQNNAESTREERSHPTNFKVSALSIRELEEDPSEPEAVGTAIIFPSESRRYSRGSRGSTTTTIWDEGSRADSSSVNLARNSARDLALAQGDGAADQLPSSTYAPHPPPNDGQPPRPAQWAEPYRVATREHERPLAATGPLLPEIEGAGEGLGLSIQPQPPRSFHHHHAPPPRPAYSPPPPPPQPSIEQTAAATARYTPSLHGTDPPESLPAPANMPPVNSISAPLLAEPADSPAPREDPGDDPNVATVPDITLTTADPDLQTLKQRYRVLEEMITSEKLYCVDMMCAASIFYATSGEVFDERERKLVFCNTHEIDKLSHKLYNALKRGARPIANPKMTPMQKREEEDAAEQEDEEITEAMRESADDDEWDEFANLNPENDKKTTIGEVFKEFLPRLERLYTTYLLNHGDASDFIKSKNQDGNTVGWEAACFTHSKDLTNAWDLDSLLVKPVQRIMKYPLLLEALEKATSADHPDLQAIREARQEFLDINTRINQARHRQETLREATKEGKKFKKSGLLENRLGRKFFVKAMAERNKDMSRHPSITQVFSDDEYDFLAQKFGGHFLQIQVVIRDIENYLEAMTMSICNLNCFVVLFVALMESAPSSYPEIESQWRVNTMCFLEIQQVFLEDHKMAIRAKVLKPIFELWNLHSRPQKLMTQRKKGLTGYVKYKQALDRNDKIDAKQEEHAKSFLTINDTLKLELPLLYKLTKKCMGACLNVMMKLQLDWWLNCQKKILPLLEYEPEHTTDLKHDLSTYVKSFHSDFNNADVLIDRLKLTSRTLLDDVPAFQSPRPDFVDFPTSYPRKSTSRRTESMGSNMSSLLDPNKRNSDGGQSRSRTSPAVPAAMTRERERERAQRRMRAGSDRSESTVVSNHRQHQGEGYTPFTLDGGFENAYPNASSMASSLLSPTSAPSSSRTSGVFNSALPMSDSGLYGTREDAPTTPATPSDQDEPEVLFLAASLFEFNIAHDRREGGIPYLVYVPGEIFDVIGMKGELWLARNQDDSTRTVGWIWEKHFARILPEDG